MKLFLKLPFVFILSLALCAATLIFAAVSHRALIGDGSNWFFIIINNKEFIFDHNYCRYLDLLLQMPALLVVRFMDGDVSSLALSCLDFAYGMHPLLSLFATAIILKKKEKLSYFVFPALSLALATMSTIPLATGEAANALSVFWPLLALVLFSNKGSFKEQIAIILLTLGLAFSYEPAIILFCLLLLVSFLNFQGWRWPLLFLSGTCWLAYRLFSPTTSHLRGNFHLSLSAPLDTFRIFTIVVFAVFLLAFLIGKYRWGWKLIWGLLSMCSAFFLYFTYIRGDSSNLFFVGPTTAFNSRITAVPAGFAIAALMVAVNWWLKEKEIFFSQKIFNFVGVVLLVVAYVDFDRTVRWNKARYYLINYVIENPGCRIMPRQEFEQHFLSASLSDYGLAHASILFQESKAVKGLVFVDNDNHSPVDPCKNHKDNYIRTAQGSEIHTNLYFDFSNIQFGPAGTR